MDYKDSVQITLTIRQVIALAECAGLTIEPDTIPQDEIEIDTEMTIATNQYIIDQDTGEKQYHTLICWFTDYKEDGAMELV